MFQVSKEIIYGNDEFSKAKCQKFLVDLFDHVNMQAVTPKMKFYALTVQSKWLRCWSSSSSEIRWSS